MKENVSTSAKTLENNNVKTSMVTDFGIRSLHKLRFSKSVLIPKIALTNCGPIEANMVHVTLVQEKGQKYIRIDPIFKPKEERKN
jgi:hypothetical protein